eukprot:COSAG05_NODE_489_length_9314_cov_115.648655_2_plen_41_part_00
MIGIGGFVLALATDPLTTGVGREGSQGAVVIVSNLGMRVR